MFVVRVIDERSGPKAIVRSGWFLSTICRMRFSRTGANGRHCHLARGCDGHFRQTLLHTDLPGGERHDPSRYPRCCSDEKFVYTIKVENPQSQRSDLMKMLKGVKLGLASVAVLGLAACSAGGTGETPQASDPGTPASAGALAMSFGGLDITIWVDVLAEMKPIIEEAGFEFLSDDPQWDVQRQAANWDAWLARGDVRAIMAFPVQADALVPVTQRALDANVPIFGYTTKWEGVQCALLTDPVKDGYLLGESAADWISENGGDSGVKVAVMSDREADLTRGRTEGIVAAIEELAPNAEIFELPGLSREVGLSNAQAQLAAHPDTTIWLSVSNDNIQGAYQALANAGVAPDDGGYLLGSLDVTNETLDIIKTPMSIWRVAFAFPTKELAMANAGLLISAGRGESCSDYTITPKAVTAANADEYYAG